MKITIMIIVVMGLTGCSAADIASFKADLAQRRTDRYYSTPAGQTYLLRRDLRNAGVTNDPIGGYRRNP